jgi:biotin carboxyl carrier protein
MMFDALVAGRELRLEIRGREGHYRVRIGDREISADLVEVGGDLVSLLLDGRSYELGLERIEAGYRVCFPGDTLDVELQDATRDAHARPRGLPTGPARVVAPMPGRVVRIFVKQGDNVVEGQGLVVMEAMKMENEIRAPRPGRIRDVAVCEGQAVDGAAPLVVVE